jgi:alpha-mannosidase
MDCFLILDVEIHHLEKVQQLKFANIKIVDSGPLFGAVVAEVKYGKSTIKVTVSAGRDVSSRR